MDSTCVIIENMNIEKITNSPAPDLSPAQTSSPAPTFALPKVRDTVIVMHASVGSGHRSAANAIAQALELLRDTQNAQDNTNTQNDASTQNTQKQSPEDAQAQKPAPEEVQIPEEAQQPAAKSQSQSADAKHAPAPKDLKVEVLDVLSFGRIIFDGDKTASMFTGATRPIYDLTWRYTFTGRFLWAGGTIWSHINFPAFTEHVRKTRPLAIVCTHITAANVAVGARMLLHESFPIICVPTDYEVEGLWPHLHADLFCVANEAMAETLRPRKVNESRILITGIPARPAFRETFDKKTERKNFNLPENKRVVLALAGAYLPRPYVHFREALDKLLPYLHSLGDVHLVIVAGNDAEYAKHLRDTCAELKLENVSIFDYVENMAALMAASDVVICKSGGLTVTECLCAQVPMVLLGRAYGQEKANVITLTSSGAAMHVTTWRELLDAMRYIDNHPESIRSMLTNAAFLRKPNAAIDIAQATLDLAAAQPCGDESLQKKKFAHFYWGNKPAHIR